MAEKEIAKIIKLQIPAGKATPAPPVGPALGGTGINIMQFVKEFNDKTAKEAGMIIPIVLTVYKDKSFTFITKEPPMAVLIKKAAKIEKASGKPNRDKVATITKAQVEEIAKLSTGLIEEYVVKLEKRIKEILKTEVKRLIDIYKVNPCLAIIKVGNDPASEIYVRNKVKAATFCCIETRLINFDENITMDELLSMIDVLNNDIYVHGILVQLPLPKHLDERVIIDRINDSKDVDGFGLLNKGKLFCSMDALTPATPTGIMTLLEEYNIEVEGKEAVVVGRSNIVGKPMAMLLLNKNATVTIAHSRTKNLSEVTKRADILVAAIGKAKFITANMVKPGATVIDVGINRVDDKLYGDVDFENVEKIAQYITPVPGGVGPLTIATLLENTVKAYKKIVK